MACNIIDPITWASCPGKIVVSVAGDAFAAVAKDFGQAADGAINWLWAQLGSATAVSLSGPGFETDLAIVAAIAGVIAVGLFVIQVGLSALRRDPGGLARAVKGLFVAFIGGGLAIGTVGLLLTATDDLCAGVVSVATGGSIERMGQVLLAGTVANVSGNPAVTMVLAVAALGAVVVVWGALMVRKALIVVTAVFAPLAFAGSLADITVGWTRRWVETTLALVAAKLLLVLVFMVGLGLFSGAGQAGSGAGQTITQVVTGLLVLALAGFCPWVALKLVHFVGDQAHHLHLLAATSSAGAAKAYGAARKAEVWATSAAASGGGGIAATGAAAPRSSTQQPAGPNVSAATGAPPLKAGGAAQDALAAPVTGPVPPGGSRSGQPAPPQPESARPSSSWRP
jgi:hypothetical protein